MNFALWGENVNFHFLQLQCGQMPNEKLSENNNAHIFQTSDHFLPFVCTV